MSGPTGPVGGLKLIWNRKWQMSMYDKDEMYPQYQPEIDEIKENAMSFQDARNLEGQMDAKGYQLGVSMIGTIVSIQPKEYNKQGKPTQQIVLTDTVGETQKVKIWLGNGPDILPSDINTQQSFTSLGVNPWQGKIYYKAFWDNMHPPQGEATHLNAETQAIIDRHRGTAGQQVMDRMGGIEPRDPSGGSYPTPEPALPTQRDYQAEERKKIVGMCFTNLLAARLYHVPACEIVDDTGEIAALWQLSNMCFDGTGQVADQPNF